MSKSPSPPSNPFTRSDTFGKPEAPMRSATAGLGDGSHTSPNSSSREGSAPPAARSAMAGASLGKTITGKPLASGDLPAPKKNPFERNKAPAEAKPPATPKPDATTSTKPGASGFASESGYTSAGPSDASAGTAGTAQAIVQPKAIAPDDFAQRVKESQKPVSSADIENVTSSNYTNSYELREAEKAEARKLEIKHQQAEEIKKAQEIAARGVNDQANIKKNSQAELARNAALAQQARDLQGQIANLRNQVFADEEQRRVNAIRVAELEQSLYQIPSHLW